MLNELKKFKVQTLLVLDYKKSNYCKIFHASAKLIECDSGINETFKSMLLTIMIKIKKYAYEDCIVLDAIIKRSIKIFECQYKEKK